MLVVAKKSLAEEQYQDFEVRGSVAFLLALSPTPLTVFPPFLLLWPRPMSLLSTPGSSLCLERSSLMELHGTPPLLPLGLSQMLPPPGSLPGSSSKAVPPHPFPLSPC